MNIGKLYFGLKKSVIDEICHSKVDSMINRGIIDRLWDKNFRQYDLLQILEKAKNPHARNKALRDIKIVLSGDYKEEQETFKKAVIACLAKETLLTNPNIKNSFSKFLKENQSELTEEDYKAFSNMNNNDIKVAAEEFKWGKIALEAQKSKETAPSVRIKTPLENNVSPTKSQGGFQISLRDKNAQARWDYIFSLAKSGNDEDVRQFLDNWDNISAMTSKEKLTLVAYNPKFRVAYKEKMPHDMTYEMMVMATVHKSRPDFSKNMLEYLGKFLFPRKLMKEVDSVRLSENLPEIVANEEREIQSALKQIDNIGEQVLKSLQKPTQKQISSGTQGKPPVAGSNFSLK